MKNNRVKSQVCAAIQAYTLKMEEAPRRPKRGSRRDLFPKTLLPKSTILLATQITLTLPTMAQPDMWKTW